MNCSDFQVQLGPLLDRELPESEAEPILRHLGDCEACNDEFERLSALAESIAAVRTPAPPAELWAAVDTQLRTRQETIASNPFRWFRSSKRAAAIIVIAAGMGFWAFLWPKIGAPRAEASIVQFQVLLDNISGNADKALRRFLVMYQGVEISPVEATGYAPALNFEIPDPLPGGFRLGPVYALRFGQSPGIVARYSRGDEMLLAIFHPPVHGEDFGTHRDYPCIIGKHRGHKVSVGEWQLVHVTDPTTCHCVLSRLDELHELPPVLSAIAPQGAGLDGATHDHDD